jgi:uncharacterized membrane protein
MDTVSIFCAIDDFCNLFGPRVAAPKQRDRKPRLCFMQNTKTVVNSALAGVLALGVLGLSQQMAAEKRPEGEKCYGIAKAGKNGCQTAASACAVR